MTATIEHPAFEGPIRASETLLPDDSDGATAATVALMRQYALEDASSPQIQADALDAIGDVDPSTLSQRAKAEAAWAFVKQRVSFVQDSALSGASGLDNDPSSPVAEVLIRPRDMSVMGKTRTGDCDDFSMYLASILQALGVRSSFATIAADPALPGQWSHVYVAAYPDGERLPLDASHGSTPGWESANATRIEEYPLDNQGVVMGIVVALIVVWMLRGGSFA